MLYRRPLTALMCLVALAGILAGCGTSAPQAAATAVPDQPTAPATDVPAPAATSTDAPAPAATSTPTAAQASPTQAATATVATGTGPTATAASTPPPLGGASSPVPQPIIDQMIADLAKLTGVDPAQISVVRAEAVTWRDGSLGCPRPGMMYPQVLSEGFRVVLAADGKEYAYHGSDRGTFFYCANPSQ